MFGDQSISSRITWMTLLVIGFALLIACISFILYDRVSVKDAMIRSLSSQAQIVGSNSVSAITFNDPEAATATLQALQSVSNITSAGIVLPNGTMFAQYRRSDRPELVELPTMPANLLEAHSFQPDRLVLAHKITLQDQWIGTVYICSDYSVLSRRFQRYLSIAAAVLLFSMLAGLFLLVGFRRSLIKPIVELSDTARAISKDRDYTVRAAPRSELAEVSVLVNAFNDMLGQIELRDEALRRAHAELEQRVQDRTRQLIAANRELEAFSYSVSHDLRGPLDTINGFAYMFLSEYADRIGGGREFIQQIQAASRRMADLIEDLLKLSHVTSSSMHTEDVDLSQMVTSIAEQLRRKEPDRKVQFKIQERLRTAGDSRLLRIAMENLIENAWKYTSAHPSATIEFGSIEHREGTEYFVKDDGAGFDPAFSDKLFQPFNRLHAKSEFPGTGIGLATVQRIIHRHGGEIWARSTPENGATFFFTLHRVSRLEPQPQHSLSLPMK